jgi:DNA-directed RNA polymerase specialized sigma24 family protein
MQQTIQQIDRDDDNDAAILLWHAMEQIRGEFQANVFEAFLLSSIDGLTASEIEAKLGMKPNAIQQAKFRVRGRLREVYGDLVS